MSSPVTLPRRSWLERSTLAVIVMLILSAVVALAGWATHQNTLPTRWPVVPDIRFGAAFSLLILGVVLLGLELQRPRFVWLAVLVILAELVGLANYLGFFNAGIRSWVAHASTIVSTAPANDISLPVTLALLWTGLLLLSRHWIPSTRARRLVTALTGSIIACGGLVALISYKAILHDFPLLGGDTGVSPMVAFGTVFLGLGLLLHAWLETRQAERAAPRWIAWPVMVVSLMFTLILWSGLQNREQAYVADKIQTAANALVVQINTEFTRQVADISQLARRWSDADDYSTDLRQADALAQMAQSRLFGCTAISYIGPDLINRWVWPQTGNEALAVFDNSRDPVRSAAIRSTVPAGREPILRRLQTVVSPSLDLMGLGRGFIIYAPVVRHDQVIGYVAGHYLYAPFFQGIIRSRVDGAGEFQIKISIADEPLFTAPAAQTELNDRFTVTKSYVVFDRRLLATLTPSVATVRHEERHLPGLALLSGIGATLLLGLSLHLARRARDGQRATEQANLRLQGENEERRRAEARLKQSDERLHLALDSSLISIFEWDVPSHRLLHESVFWTRLGYDSQRMAPTLEDWMKLIHPDDLPGYQHLVEAQVQGRRPAVETEFRLRDHADRWRWFSLRSKVVSGALQPAVRIIGTMQDVTARRQTEQALRDSQAETRKMALVAAKTDNPVLIGRPDGTIEWANESFTRIMEYSLPEITGLPFEDFIFSPGTDLRAMQQVRTAIARGLSIGTDVVQRTKSGREYHHHLEVQPVYAEAGHLANFIIILTDITARVETERQLRQAKTDADSASRSKSDFLATMSHEIRTPMNGVIGMTSLLMDTSLSADQREYANTIRSSGEALLRIIDDILDFSKIESGHMNLEEAPLDLARCLEEALDVFALQTSAKHLELTSCIEPDVPAWIISDAVRLRQIIVNLVNNAVKFTERGAIAVTVRRLPAPDAASARLEFTVRDTGIGIPADRLNRLFQAFSQGDASTTRRFGGTGLGLAISQRLCVLMGGGIRVESVPGTGSAFIFTIQAGVAPAPGDQPLPPLPAALKTGPVLCVAAHPVTRRQLQLALEAWGAHCLLAAGPTEAAALASRSSYSPALLLMEADETDVQMPPAWMPSLTCPRLVMLPFGQSASDVPSGGLPFGAINKPVKTAALRQAVVRLFAASASPAAPAVPPNGEWPHLAGEIPLTMLLAEDNAINQKVALRLLQRLGYTADLARNGLEAVAMVKQRPYDVILMDLQMPGLDGYAAAREIRRQSSGPQPKIIALTANVLEDDRQRCREAGMDDFISKPVRIPDIVAALRRQFPAVVPPAPSGSEPAP